MSVTQLENVFIRAETSSPTVCENHLPKAIEAPTEKSWLETISMFINDVNVNLGIEGELHIELIGPQEYELRYRGRCLTFDGQGGLIGASNDPTMWDLPTHSSC